MGNIGFSRLQHLLLALLFLAMTGCGANNLTGASNSNTPGNVTAKLVWGDSAAKSTGKAVAAIPTGVSTIRLSVVGSDANGKAIPVVKSQVSAAATGTVTGIYPGKVSLSVEALDSTGTVLYEGNALYLVVTSGNTTDAGTIVMSPPVYKAESAPCVGCHETTLDGTGQGIVAGYKNSGHYTNTTVVPAWAKNGATQAGCAGCHGSQHNDGDPATSGRCAECHTSIPGGNHSTTAGGKYLAGMSSKNCGTCHQPHNPLGPIVGGSCVKCHSVGQNKFSGGGPNGLVNDNNGVRAITGEFAKWSHHVDGTVTLNDAHCAACHLEGNIGSDGKVNVDTAYHMVDNKTHLRNADTDADMQWNPAAPSFTTMDTFCLSCHDSDGATSAMSVKIQKYINDNNVKAPGKTASATNPFGDSISNDYDFIERPAVVDAKGQFAVTNNSHHAVLGKKYTGRTRVAGATRAVASPTTFAANSSATLPGKRSTIYDAGKFQSDYTTLADAAGETDAPGSLNGRNGGTTLGDDSTLHCGDCHTVGQFSNKQSDYNTRYNKAVIGAHGSNNEYMLRNNVGTDARHQGAETVIAGGNADNGTYGTKAYLVCFNCHAFKTYGTITSNNGETGVNHAGEYTKDQRCNGPYNTIFGNMTGEGRLRSMGTATSLSTYGKFIGGGAYYANMFGIQCANCHNSGVKGNIFGGIHGSKVPTYTDGMGNASKHIRFLPGLGNAMYVPGVKGGFTGGTAAVYKAYSGNRNGTGSGNSLGQTWTLLPARTIKYTNSGDNQNGSYQYITGGVSNDLNWEQRTQQPIAGEVDLQSKAVGCYTVTPNAPNFTYSASGNKTTTGSAPTGQQKNPKVVALQAGGYPADDVRNAATTGLTAGDGREVFDIWGGCDDHNGAQGAGTGMVRKVLRKISY